MSRITELLDILKGAADPRRHRDLLEALWQEERWFDASHQRAAAELAAERLRRAGLADVDLQPYLTDGRTRYQDWMTRLSWECPEAWLGAVDSDGPPLADRSACPAAVVMGSGPLGEPDAPVRGRVIDLDAGGEITPQEVRGAFVLTGGNPHSAKVRLAAAGAGPAAVVSDHAHPGVGYDEDTTAWINAWSDDPDGWYVHAGDSVMAGFMLSPRQGRRLRELLAARPDLELEGVCRSTLEPGEGQCVTGLIEGESQQEVWIYGHGCEQGASDNCSGVSTLIEAATRLAELIRRGGLPRPKRSIRVIITEECLGMAAFATIRDDLRRCARCGLNVDAVGDASSLERPFNLEIGPLSNPSFGWAAAGLIGDELARRLAGRWFLRPALFVPTADDMIGDPACGIPSLWLGHGKEAVGYHSSADVPSICQPESLEAAALLTAAWALTMASLDEALRSELTPPASAWLDRWLVAGTKGEAGELRRWAAAQALSPKPLPLAANLERGPGEDIERLTWGTMTLETIEPSRRGALSRWNEAQQAFLYWIGRGCSVGEASDLTRAEAGELQREGIETLLELGIEAGCLKRT